MKANFPTYKEIAKKAVEEALDGYIYQGKTMREWVNVVDQWQELKETIIELRDGDGTGTQQETCKFLANYMDVLEKNVSSSENPNKWIPVSERMPEEEVDVLICNKDGEIQISRGSYSTEAKDCWIWYTSGWSFGKAEAWMPLPEPYKAESEG